MKKLFKLTSVVLAILMVMTSITAVSVFADEATTVGKLTVGNGTSYDINLGVDGAKELALTSDNLEVYALSWNKGACTKQDLTVTKVDAKKDTAVAILKLPLPVFGEGKTLDKYILRFSGQVSSWTALELPGSALPTFSTTNYEAVKAVCAGEVAGTSTMQHDFGKVAYTAIDSNTHQVYVNSIDVTEYAKSCLAAGQSHFFLGLHAGTSNYKLYVNRIISGLQNINGVDYSNESKMYVYYTEADAPALNFSSVDAPASKDDGVAFVYNNPIDASSVAPANFTVTNSIGDTMTVTDSDISVAGATVTLTLPWEEYETYTVTLKDVADVYGQTLSTAQRSKFDISAEETTQTLSLKSVMMMCDDNSDNNDTNKTVCTNNGHTNNGPGYYNKTTKKEINLKYHYALMQFDLSGLPSDKMVSGAELSVVDNYGKVSGKLYVVPDYDWTTDSGADSAYYTSLKSALTDANKLSATCTSTSKPYYFYADASQAVIAAANNGKDVITFATGNSNGSASLLQIDGSSYPAPVLTLKLVEPKLSVKSATPAKGGVMDGVGNNIELTLATTLSDECKSYIELQDMDGDKVEAAISVNGSKVTIDPSDDLAERTDYKVVLKAGFADEFDNSVAADKTIYRFTSGTALQIDSIKFTSDAAPVDYDTVNVISSYQDDSSVTAVARITNGSQSELSAIMIIALYDSDHTLLKVDAVGGPFAAPANQTTQFTKTIEVDQDLSGTYINAFIWKSLDEIRPVCVPASISQEN